MNDDAKPDLQFIETGELIDELASRCTELIICMRLKASTGKNHFTSYQCGDFPARMGMIAMLNHDMLHDAGKSQNHESADDAIGDGG